MALQVDEDVRLVLSGLAVPEGFAATPVTFTTAEYLGQSLHYPKDRFDEVIVFHGQPSRVLRKNLCRRGHRQVAVVDSAFETLSSRRKSERRFFVVWAKPRCGVRL